MCATQPKQIDSHRSEGRVAKSYVFAFANASRTTTARVLTYFGDADTPTSLHMLVWRRDALLRCGAGGFLFLLWPVLVMCL